MQNLWEAFAAGDHDRVIQGASSSLASTGAIDLLHLLSLSLIARHHPSGLRIADAVLAMTTSPVVANNTAVTLLDVGEAAEAERVAREGIARTPDASDLHFAVGNALLNQKSYADAAQAFRACLSLAPEHRDAQMNLGNALLATGVLDAAVACYDAVLATDPGYMIARLNRANALSELDPGSNEIESEYRRVADAGIPEGKLALAHCRLTAGDLEEGWRLYQSRWDCAVSAPARAGMRWPRLPSLDAARGRRVLLTPEGGYGDVLHFVRYAPMLAEAGASVTLGVEPPLRRLFEVSFPAFKLVTDRSEAGDQDYEATLMDLPFIFGTRLETIPGAIPYLYDGGHQMETSRDRRVGLVWAAGRPLTEPGSQRFNAQRSVPLTDLAPLADVDGVEFVSLQMGVASEQVEPAGMRLSRPLPPDADFLDTARIVRNLDLVVTVCTSVAHLAGAMGKPTWVLNSRRGCWRWMRGREDTPWYPRVMRLFNQPKDDLDWSLTVGRLRRALVAWTKRR